MQPLAKKLGSRWGRSGVLLSPRPPSARSHASPDNESKGCCCILHGPACLRWRARPGAGLDRARERGGGDGVATAAARFAKKRREQQQPVCEGFWERADGGIGSCRGWRGSWEGEARESPTAPPLVTTPQPQQHPKPRQHRSNSHRRAHMKRAHWPFPNQSRPEEAVSLHQGDTTPPAWPLIPSLHSGRPPHPDPAPPKTPKHFNSPHRGEPSPPSSLLRGGVAHLPVRARALSLPHCCAPSQPRGRNCDAQCANCGPNLAYRLLSLSACPSYAPALPPPLSHFLLLRPLPPHPLPPLGRAHKTKQQ